MHNCMSGVVLNPDMTVAVPCPDCGSPYARCQDSTTCPEAAIRIPPINQKRRDMHSEKAMATMTARERVLEEAKRCVLQDRNKQYGPPEDSFNDIGGLWNAYIGDRMPEYRLTAVDVAMMLSLMKIARIKANPNHFDSKIDLAGYAACSGEMRVHDPVRNMEVASEVVARSAAVGGATAKATT